MVVMEVVSQYLDEHKNNGLIFKLQRNSVRTDLSMLSCMIFNKSCFYALTLKLIWYLLDIHRNGFVKFHEDLMCLDSPFLFYK